MARKQTKRPLQVGEWVRRKLSLLIRDEMNDPRVATVTITAVDVTGDLSRAKVYISHFGERSEVDETVSLLNKARGFLRSLLAKHNTLYTVPELVFFRDKTHIEGRALEALINRAVRKQKEEPQ